MVLITFDVVGTISESLVVWSGGGGGGGGGVLMILWGVGVNDGGTCEEGMEVVF